MALPDTEACNENAAREIGQPGLNAEGASCPPVGAMWAPVGAIWSFRPASEAVHGVRQPCQVCGGFAAERIAASRQGVR